MPKIIYKILTAVIAVLISSAVFADGAKLPGTVTISGAAFQFPNTTTLTGYYDVRSGGTSGGEFIRISKNLQSQAFNMSNIISVSAEDSNGTRFSCSVIKAFDPDTFATLDQLSVLTHGVGVRILRDNTNGRCVDNIIIYFDSRYGQP